ncbi:MAG: ATP-binding cassette domain-containing protein [Bryobacteraceae bacterium]|nr:ATP-binding cassette domain-containing protein [Bryobacteraceae bacterium]
MIDIRIRCRGPHSDTLDAEWRSEAKSTLLAGRAGAGKTLLLRALCGLARPDEGRIALAGQVVFDGPAGVNVSPARRGVAFIPSEPSLAARLSVRDHLTLACRASGRVERSRQVEAMLDEAGLLDHAARDAAQLLPGLQLRTAAARALIAQPRLLLIDEPVRGLDANLINELRGVIDAAVNGHGVRVVVCSRGSEAGLDLAQEVLLLEDGRIARQGSGADWLDDPGNDATVRWLDRHAIVEAEILALDPGRRSSRLLCQPESEQRFEAAAPYFPGLLKGARIRVAIRCDRVLASGRGPGLPCALDDAREAPVSIRLRFTNGLAADVTRREWEPFRHNKVWNVEIPPEAVRLLR